MSFDLHALASRKLMMGVVRPWVSPRRRISVALGREMKGPTPLYSGRMCWVVLTLRRGWSAKWSELRYKEINISAEN